MPAYIRIVSPPPGEAPDWVRQAWVGIRLPLAQWTRTPHARLGFGVLSGPRGLAARLFAVVRGRAETQVSYSVNVSSALDELERHRPDAAAWWRAHAPHLLSKNRKFLFAIESCSAEP